MRLANREVAWAKNSLVRKHGWSPVTLVFGREPRIFGELYKAGNPAGFHPQVGDSKGDVAVRMRMRYQAKLASMLLGTAHQRSRKIVQPRVGHMVSF